MGAAGRYDGDDSVFTACEDCAAGKYSPAVGSTACIDCAPGQYTAASDDILLFTCTGSSNAYQNDAVGWYTDARTTSGCGTRASYYDTPIEALRLSDSADNYVEYTLTAPYAGRSLHSIVSECMGDARSNTGGSR